MFTEIDGSRKTIGDVDILWHEGLYHLFHLVLPNHDFIAHAVSTDGIHWRRVRNSLFIGDPGSWDDLMLWTMHVSKDPNRPERWRMFYTGLSRRDRGRFQRIGLATSDDLYRWEKQPVNWTDGRGPNDPELVKKAREDSSRSSPNDTTATIDPKSCFPLEPDPEFYEADLDGPRRLISFRDPFFTRCGGSPYLLISGRVKDGPIVRRGCVALMEEVTPDHFESRAPLHHPQLYDDLEVPNLIRIEDQLYLIASLREDAKIRYWHGDSEDASWLSYHDNVLMPQGNYAGRVCRDENGWLLWCFYAMNHQDRTEHNLMPPPKRLAREESGLLYVKTYERFEEWCSGEVEVSEKNFFKPLQKGDDWNIDGDCWETKSRCGFQGFLSGEDLENFWMTCRLKLEGRGKCGLLLRMNRETHDGYYLSLDLYKGVAQLRAWDTCEEEEGEHMMCFETLQTGFWFTETPGEAEISMLAFGSYLEFSVAGRIVLSLASRHFERGGVGVYLDTAEMNVENFRLRRMKQADQFDDQLISG